jgi:hypothetical protein
MVADILVKARAEEIRQDAGSALRGVLDSLSVVGRGNRRLRGSGHDENDKRGNKASVEVQNADGDVFMKFYTLLLRFIYISCCKHWKS